jgi:uncharacterized phage protein (TIGR01671 family)
MREIKFRGKRLDNGEWLYGSLVILNGRYFIFDDANRHEVDPTTVGEFTGLKDKNGKEIYEGDVIRSPLSEDKTRPHRIFYHTGNAAFMGALVDRKELCYLRLDQDWIYKFGKEVIGNIHDHNPEFLKGGEQ